MVKIERIKLIEDDEMRGKGRRPSPIEYAVDENGCWRVLNRVHIGYPGKEMPVMRYRGVQVQVARFIWSVVAGKALSRTARLYSTCGHAWCVNPDHKEMKEMNDVLE